MSTSLGSKLRDSCHACAVSKVKCQKEKPACSRCTRRGTACQYFVTKRPGRKCSYRAIEQVQALDSTRVLPESDWSATSSSVSSPSPTLEHLMDGADAFAGLLPPQDLYQSAFLSTSDASLDGCIPSPIRYFSPEGHPDASNPVQSDVHTRNRGSSSVSGSSNGCSSNISAPLNVAEDNTALLGPNTESIEICTSHPFLEPEVYAASDKQVSQEVPCPCLRTALNFLGIFPPLRSTHETPTEQRYYSNRSNRLLELQTVMEMNGKIMESLGNIIQCSCSRDGYVLAIICLVVSKVLSCYAEAAHEVRLNENIKIKSTESFQFTWSAVDSTQAAELSGPGRKPNDDMGPISAPHILSELYRVQRLVEDLGKRLKLCRTQSQSFVNDLYSSEDTAFPFSASVLDQLGDGLRKRLNALSLQIIDVLRRDWN